jgi:putative hydrolase of the HAD superfamily
MLKAIAFVLWETLITDPPEQSRAQERLRLERMERVLRDAGFVTEAQRLEDAYRGTWHRCQELYWSADRDISCRTQVEHFLELLECTAAVDVDALEEAYARAAIDILPLPVPGARELVAELKDRGYRLGLISNTGRTPGSALREILDALDLAPFLDAMVFSNEHGECKPQPSIFETLRASLAVRAEEIVFVGDNLYVDVHGAQRCGMRAVHFIPERRGNAVAPAVDHGLEIAADAVIRDLAELPEVLARINARINADAAARTGTR